MQADLLLKGGHLIDPRNNLDSAMDVAISGGVVAAVDADLSSVQAAQTIDITGLYVTPGLIDIHVHLYYTPANPRAWAGDYSIQGLETRVAVERKSIDDFVSTVIRSRARFHRELTRLRDYEAACVVVEADMADVFAGRFRSAAHPASVFGAMQSIIVDFGIPVFFCSDRQIACRFTQDYLLRFHQRAREADDVQP